MVRIIRGINFPRNCCISVTFKPFIFSSADPNPQRFPLLFALSTAILREMEGLSDVRHKHPPLVTSEEPASDFVARRKEIVTRSRAGDPLKP